MYERYAAIASTRRCKDGLFLSYENGLAQVQQANGDTPRPLLELNRVEP